MKFKFFRFKFLVLFVPLAILFASLFIPIKVHAVFYAPLFNFTANENAINRDNDFSFHIFESVPPDPTQSLVEDFNITTINSLGSIKTSPVVGYGKDFYITQDAIAGWQAPQVTCSSADPSVIFTYINGGVEVDNATPFNYTTCNFTNNPAPIAKTPVIIIPGVLGTEISKSTEDGGSEKLWLDLSHNLTSLSDDFMDPLQFNADLTPSDSTLTVGDVIKEATLNNIHAYNYTDGLMTEFKNQGYTEGTNLFLFPYDWRYGVSDDTVAQLKQKISDILTQTGATKVDIIAHSTGGLIVKKYVMENPTDNDIDKAIFVGVPNTGAPKAVKALIEGDDFGNYFVSDDEMQKISQNLPVAYDLLPSQQYFDTKGSYVKIVNENGFTNTSTNLDFNHTNSFLTDNHQLNGQALSNAENLHTTDFDNYDLRTAGVDLYAVDGCKAGTMGKFIESDFQNLLGGNPTVNYTLEDTPGDGTVPLESATNLPINDSNKYYALTGQHADLLSEDGPRQEIVNIISGSNLSTQDSHGKDLVTQDISKCNLDGHAISVFSPLSIDVVDQDGNHSGFTSNGSVENNIPNADFEVVGEHKFVYLPTDDGQTYTISVAGTGTGTFTITDTTLADSDITQTQVFSDISVTPSLLGHVNISNNSNTTLTLDTDGNGTVDETLQPNSVLDAADSENFVPDEKDSNLPPVNATVVPSGGAGLVATPVVTVSNIPAQPVNITTISQSAPVAQTSSQILSQPITQTLTEMPAVVATATPQALLVKTIKSENYKIVPKPKPIILNSMPEIPLTANVESSNVPVGSKIILGGLLGFLIILIF